MLEYKRFYDDMKKDLKTLKDCIDDLYVVLDGVNDAIASISDNNEAFYDAITDYLEVDEEDCDDCEFEKDCEFKDDPIKDKFNEICDSLLDLVNKLKNESK